MSRAARVGLGVAIAFWLVVAAGIWLAWPAVGQLLDPGRTRRFYIPAESMLPTLRVGDSIRPRRVSAGNLRRGAVIVFQGPETARVDRIVGVAGDIVALRHGSVIINGVTVMQRDLGPGPVQEGEATRLFGERLPGEALSHRVIDMGPSEGDEFGPLAIPAGTLFVLGDNRDRSADSRYPTPIGGVGLVPEDAVIGVVDRLLWSRGFRDLGRPLDIARH